MAGSRKEMLGSVFTRVTGLIKSGAMSNHERPVWYDVMASFPPRIPPNYERPVSQKQPINILYKEDIERADFFKRYVTNDIINLKSKNHNLTSEKFINEMKLMDNESGKVTIEEQMEILAEKLRKEGHGIYKISLEK